MYIHPPCISVWSMLTYEYRVKKTRIDPKENRMTKTKQKRNVKSRSYDDLKKHVEDYVDYIPETGCHISRYSPDSRGYVKTFWMNKTLRLHRVVVSTDRADYSGEWAACHRCDEPSCVNPKHLYRGSQLTNRRDKVARGRDRQRPRKGSANGMSKLTEEDVVRIRELCNARELRFSDIAKEYGVRTETISEIHNRRKWRHV